MKYLKQLMFVIIFFTVPASIIAGTVTINDSSSLGNLKTGKGVFLVDIGDVKKLNFYLKIIQGTYKSMERQGVKADFVLVYIGPSVKYLSNKSAEKNPDVDEAVLMEIEANIEALADLGIRQEVCSVATEVFGIRNDSLFEDLKIVGDGFISLIGYQSQGYYLVPVF